MSKIWKSKGVDLSKVIENFAVGLKTQQPVSKKIKDAVVSSKNLALEYWCETQDGPQSVHLNGKGALGDTTQKWKQSLIWESFQSLNSKLSLKFDKRTSKISK